MCGIVGVAIKAINGFNMFTENTFYQMLLADSFRGEDSTGVVFVENDSSFGIMKEAFSSTYLIENFKDSDQGKAMFNRGKALIGHNRKATLGAISETTAHPFVVGDQFALVHNGTLKGHKALADTVVDSEALAIHLSKVLVKDFDKSAFEEAIGKVNGAYAVVAYNQDAHCLYMFRNSERPLAYLETSAGLFFASEAAMLHWICGRNGLIEKDTEVKLLPENTLLTMNLDDNKITMEEYIPKKATHSLTTGVLTAIKTIGWAGRVACTNKGLSKNQFKAMNRQWTGRKIEFYADDFVERDYPNTISNGSHLLKLMGESEQFTCPHSIFGDYDLYDLPVGTTEYLNCLYSGTISGMDYNKATGHVVISVFDVKKTPVLKKGATNEDVYTVH